MAAKKPQTTPSDAPSENPEFPRLGIPASKVGRVPIITHNFDDENGNPAGGQALGVGFEIQWQNGPLRNEEGRLQLQTGAFVEDVTMAVIQRMEYYQASRFASPFNEAALDHLRRALVAMESRRKDRENRGVDGTHQE